MVKIGNFDIRVYLEVQYQNKMKSCLLYITTNRITKKSESKFTITIAKYIHSAEALYFIQFDTNDTNLNP